MHITSLSNGFVQQSTVGGGMYVLSGVDGVVSALMFGYSWKDGEEGGGRFSHIGF